MLRVLVLLLVLLNALYFAWSQQMLSAYGFGPTPQREPQRLAQQIRPESVRVLPADEVRGLEQPASASAATQAPAECLVAGPLDEERANAVRQAADTSLPADAWTIEQVVTPARWIVYLGKFPDGPSQARKRAELVGLGLRPEAITTGPFAPGLMLGGHESEARARTELAALARRGVRTASVVQDRPAASSRWLRLPVVDEALRARLDTLRPALGDVALRACG